MKFMSIPFTLPGGGMIRFFTPLRLIKNLNLQLNRFHFRRRYRDLISLRAKIASKTLECITFEAKPNYPGRLLQIPSNLDEIENCNKSGSWIKNFLPFGRSYYWTSKRRKYFIGFPKISHSLAAEPTMLKEAQLKAFFNCKVSSNPKYHTSLNIYGSYIKKFEGTPEIKSAVFLDISGADSFQHFVQDALPIISLLQDFNKVPKNIPLIMRQPSSSFLHFGDYIYRIGCKNPVLFLTGTNSFTVETLYAISFKPFNANYAIPPSLHFGAYNKFHSQTQNFQKQKRLVVLINREEKIRNFDNFDLLHENLMAWSKTQDLGFSVLNTKESNFEDIRASFSMAKYVFAVHGGSNYNMIWAPPDSVLVEFIPSEATDSLFHLVLSYGQTYLPYALPQDKGDLKFKVTKTDIDIILESLNLS